MGYEGLRICVLSRSRSIGDNCQLVRGRSVRYGVHADRIGSIILIQEAAYSDG